MKLCISKFTRRATLSTFTALPSTRGVSKTDSVHQKTCQKILLYSIRVYTQSHGWKRLKQYNTRSQNKQTNPGGSKSKQIKLVLLGESGVGKSSIALRYVRGEFNENGEATIGG